MSKDDYFGSQKLKMAQQGSFMTLGASPSGTFQATASFRELGKRGHKQEH